MEGAIMKSQDCGEWRNHLSYAVVCFCSSFISLGKLSSEAVSSMQWDYCFLLNFPDSLDQGEGGMRDAERVGQLGQDT